MKEKEVSEAQTRIVTRHPAGKAGFRVDRGKYELVRVALLRTLKMYGEMTNQELLRGMRHLLPSNFKGSVARYAEAVKLDLEANRLVERVPESRPEKHRLVSARSEMREKETPAVQTANCPNRTRPAISAAVPCLERRIVTGCYDHLGGVLGERLFTFLIARRWIRKAGGKDDYAITDRGWRELAAFGIDVEALRTTKRKPVTSCTERHGRAQFEHTGAHLSSLLKRRLLELGWLKARSRTDIAVTDAGYRGLAKLGIELE